MEFQLNPLLIALHLVYLENFLDAAPKLEDLLANVEATVLNVADVLQVLDVEQDKSAAGFDG